MKLYNREEFLKLPEGTFFAKGEPWCFQALSIKGASFDGDFWSLDPVGIEADGMHDRVDRFERMLGGESIPMDDAFYRDGLRESNAIFLVFEPEDLLRLECLIYQALEAAKTPA